MKRSPEGNRREGETRTGVGCDRKGKLIVEKRKVSKGSSGKE